LRPYSVPTMLKGCLTAIGAVVVVFVVIGVIAGVSKNGGSGTTSSPALVTETESTEATATTETAEPPARPQTFKGSGIENLGTIAVSVPSTLEWSCSSCDVFSAAAISTSGTDSISVSAPGRTSGVTAVEPGTYKSVEVIANETEAGSGWTIKITPGR
jgi:hypothetical protein